MRKMTLKEIQKCEFDILCFVDDLCSKEGIKYSLSDGTLIGAVRHKGFIPWDDDIDLAMTRENYDRFHEAMKRVGSDSRYQLYYYNGKIVNPYSAYMKVVDTRTKGIEPYKKDNSDTKVWVDIFPVDFLPDDPSKAKAVKKRFMRNFYCLQAKCNINSSFTKKLYRLLVLGKKPLTVASEVDKYGRVANRSNKCCNLSFVTKNEINMVFESSWFQKYVKLEFNGRFFPCVAEYDALLKTLYGDYMTLPPAEKRYSHSLDAYWVE